jgi:L-asparaginase/Glu-tRNA(Gln) amidotransferase subunit D
MNNTTEIIYAGGTISSLATPQGHREGGHIVDLVSQLEAHTPEFQGRFALGEAQVAYTGLSENLDAVYLADIAQSVTSALEREPKAAVITHGTDSMEQTARFLDTRFAKRLKNQAAKIIVTGANDDLSVPGSDAWDNLAFAFESANGDAEPGVYVAFHRKLIPASLVVKEPFDGIAMNYAARTDPGYQQALQRQREYSRELSARYGQAVSDRVIDYPVNVIRLNHQELLTSVSAKNIGAVLLTLYHSGTAHTEKPEQSVAALAQKLTAEQGITLFGVTENGEPCTLDGYETSVRLADAGIVPLGDMGGMTLHSPSCAT